MADSTANAGTPPVKGKKSLLIAMIGAVVLGGVGFATTYLGLIPIGHSTTADSADVTPAPLPNVGFLPIDPLVISLGPTSSAAHLRFGAQLECGDAYLEEVRTMLPRIVDVLNSYLRAVDLAELEDPALLPKLKAQMLRRVQIVTGEGRVNDLLISEFILN